MVVAAKHTPGPWAYDGDGRIDALAFRTPTTYTDHETGEKQVYMQGLVGLPYSCGDGSRDANGHLMAAAPDMFKTLQDMDGWLANTSHGEDHPWRISIRAAIAKATGGGAA